MTVCPDCGFENIEGSDACEQCEQPLSTLSKPRAKNALEKGIAKDRIGKLNPREPLVVEADATISWVLKLLYDHAVGCAVVISKERVPVGIFSERDALMRLGVNAKAMAQRPVTDFMTSSPETLEESDKIAYALHRMDLGGFRHVPVMSEGRVSGVISVRDVLKYVSDHLSLETT